MSIHPLSLPCNNARRGYSARHSFAKQGLETGIARRGKLAMDDPQLPPRP
jgi:hypothetical protein